MSMPDLSTLRQEIDTLDAEIQALVTRRALLAEKVAKAKYAVEDAPNFYRPEREAEVLRMAVERNKGPLPDAFINHLFREIMSACLALQNPLKVAYLGPQGTYSQAALLKHFGHGVKDVPVQTINEVFSTVEAQHAQYGIVPIENSTEGGVNQTLDCLMHSPLQICGEVELAIHHCLMSREDSIGVLNTIYTHSQSLAQCRVWLDSHLPNVKRVTVSSNAEAARLAANEMGSAAIASTVAAELYGLQVLHERIEDQADNTTRFAIVGNQSVSKTGRDKTSFMVAGSHRPGALYHLLAPFDRHDLSLTRIESRPAHQGTWEYVFFIDVEGHINDPLMQGAMQELTGQSTLLKQLGSYPRVS